MSGLREETKRAGESLVVGLVVGVFHLGFLSERFSTPQGRGGVTVLLGCTFITGLLWAMLMLRSLAADKPVGPEVDDGLVSMAVTAWLFALVPPRAANFVEDPKVDDFTRVYLPLCMVVVFLVLGAQALWPRRDGRSLWLRLTASFAVGALVLAGLVHVAGGTGEAVRALVLAGVAGLATGVQAVRARG